MLSKNQFLEIYEKVFLIRSSEEAIRKHYHLNAMKTPVHLCNGSEGIAVGVSSALPKQTKVFGTYRNHGLYLALSNDTDGFFAELYGKLSGCAEGKAGSMHLTAPEKGLMLTSAVVGTTIPVAVGAAFANKYQNNSNFSAVFFGDGAMEEGVFWESLNFACLHKLRVLFICENNDLAIHTFGDDRKGFRSFEDAVRGFDCDIAGGDGYDPIEVGKLVTPLIEKASKDPRPIFVRLDYYRYLEHVGVNEDYQAGYRKKPGQKECDDCDPLINLKRKAQSFGVTESDLAKIEKTVLDRITKSIEKAEKASFPPLSDLMDHVYA